MASKERQTEIIVKIVASKGWETEIVVKLMAKEFAKLKYL